MFDTLAGSKRKKSRVMYNEDIFACIGFFGVFD